ncbi:MULTISPECIES: hypothetical protein [unclassified Microbacterium]|uniref:hypothetical protein n=1 Tax=unclassified Microbacterium TaxID=2609290 RepID=UPI0011C3775A|nr:MULTISPECIES: hypothetical protein [unclassified Microbacterium]MBT2484641.1 hypothetical protein [Microbacterium sp. ISL-108]
MPIGGELGIQTGEYWAFRPGTALPLQRALILNPGLHYEASIRIRLIDDPAVVELWTTRAKLPCKWVDLEEYLRSHPDVPRGYPQTPEPPAQPDPGAVRLAFTANELRSIVHDEVIHALGSRKVAYTLKEAAIATGVSVSMIQAAVKMNRLVAHYAGTKPLFTPDALRAWVDSLPDEPWKITYR